MAIPAPLPQVDVITNISDRRTLRTKVDEEGVRNLIHHVVHQYADPKIGVTREYVSNGVDASVSAGTDEPVNITTPTRLYPLLTIEDHGTGMTQRELEDHMLAFGNSTKRDSNEQIGQLGLGAKSAWMVSPTFEVETVKDGLLNRVVVAASLEHEVVIADQATDAPNGTTVIIPVTRDFDEWATAAVEVAQGHRPGRVTVNGEAVESIYSGAWIGPLCTSPLSEYGEKYAILSGGASFDVPWNLASRMRSKFGFRSATLELPIGSFAHTPSRDSVIDDEAGRTRDAIDCAVLEYNAALAEAREELDKLADKDIQAALELRLSKINDLVGNASNAPRDLLPLPFYGVHTEASIHVRGGGRNRSWDRDERTCVPLESFQSWTDKMVIITGVPGKVRSVGGLGPFLNREYSLAKVAVTLRGEDTSFKLAVARKPYALAGAQPLPQHTQYIEVGIDTPGVTHVTYEEVRQANTAHRKANGFSTGARDLSYLASRITGGRMSPGVENVNLRDLTGQVYYTDEEGNYSTRQARGQDILQDGWCLFLGRRKEEVVVRAIPTARALTAALRQAAAERLEKISRAERIALAFQGSSKLDTWNRPNCFQFAALLLPLIAESHPCYHLIQALAGFQRSREGVSVKKLDSLVQLCTSASWSHCQPAGTNTLASELVDLQDALVRAYPLLREMRSHDQQDYAPYVIHTPPQS